MTTELAGARELTDLEVKFVNAYLLEPVARKAALTAGYAPESALREGSRIRNRPHVKAEIERRMMMIGHVVDIGATSIIRELGRVGFSSLGNYFEDDGTGNPVMRPWADLSPDELAAIQEILFETTTVENEDENGEMITVAVTRIKKIKLHGKTPSLELLGKHFQLFEERNRDPNDREAVFGRSVSAAQRLITRIVARDAERDGARPGADGSVLPANPPPAPNGHGAPVASGALQGSRGRTE